MYVTKWTIRTCGFEPPILSILKIRSSRCEAGRQGKENLGPAPLSSLKHTPVAGVLQFPEEQCWAQIPLPSMGLARGGGVEDGAFEQQESCFPTTCMYLSVGAESENRQRLWGFKGGRGLVFLPRNELIAFSVYCCSFHEGPLSKEWLRQDTGHLTHEKRARASSLPPTALCL